MTGGAGRVRVATWHDVRKAADALGLWANHSSPTLSEIADDHGGLCGTVHSLVLDALYNVHYADVNGPPPDPTIYRKAAVAEAMLRNGELPPGWVKRG